MLAPEAVWVKNMATARWSTCSAAHPGNYSLGERGVKRYQEVPRCVKNWSQAPVKANRASVARPLQLLCSWLPDNVKQSWYVPWPLWKILSLVLLNLCWRPRQEIHLSFCQATPLFIFKILCFYMVAPSINLFCRPSNCSSEYEIQQMALQL